MPDVLPMKSVYKAKGHSAAARGTLAALGEGAWWTQSRLFAEGKASTDRCQSCGVVRGTLKHRICSCTANDGWRSAMTGARREVLEFARKATSFGLPLMETWAASSTVPRRARPRASLLLHP